jgi:hypothetical protein
MEIAIPLVALGGMYVISNSSSSSSSSSNKKKQQEGYTNMGAQPNYLPNVNVQPQNYPVRNLSELVDTVQEYRNPNIATDKYFNQNLYESQENAGKKVGNEISEVFSLTGNYLNSSEFKHNNMVPFYGGKIKGQVYDENIAETVLDNMVGAGSQNIKKIEQAPLFKPQENMQWAYGAPNMSDFYQSRVNPGMKMSNIKPFETENVGPGLNQGYTTTGTGGFNSGMEARDAWLPKTVDEMRVATNPKMEYSLDNHQGPAMSSVKNLGIEGKMEKYRPDTFFINTQDRWFTTTGAEKGQMLYAPQEVKDTTRMDTSQSYAGVSGNVGKTAAPAPKNFQASRRLVLPNKDIGCSSAMGRGPDDQHKKLNSYTNYTNNRAIMRQPDTFRSSFSGAIGAVIAPVMDIFRPTKKDEYGCNVRVYGDAGSSVAKSYVLNPGDTPGTTVKETTLYTPNAYIGNQSNAAYTVSEQQAIANQRDTTNCSTYGNVSSNQRAEMSVDAAYRQHNNETKELLSVSRTNHGNSQIFNQQMNVNVARIDSDRNNTRMWVPNNMGNTPMSKETYGQMVGKQQYNDEQMNMARIQPNILDAFRANPYTQSLQSAV